ncbi:MAG: hypothetical protein ABIH52_02765 [Candidatus Aenigmatarchaeota archaeon]
MSWIYIFHTNDKTGDSVRDTLTDIGRQSFIERPEKVTGYEGYAWRYETSVQLSDEEKKFFRYNRRSAFNGFTELGVGEDSWRRRDNVRVDDYDFGMKLQRSYYSDI